MIAFSFPLSSDVLRWKEKGMFWQWFAQVHGAERSKGGLWQKRIGECRLELYHPSVEQSAWTGEIRHQSSMGDNQHAHRQGVL